MVGDSNPMYNNKVKEHHKQIMQSDITRNKISNAMKQYRKDNPFTAEHRKHLSESAMGNHNFGTGDTRSINCYCIVNGIRYDFHSYKDASIWWYKTFKPFGETYSEATYVRKIKSCIKNGVCSYRNPNNHNDLILITSDVIKWYN